jgi:SAM-dependent methyltransferase
MRIIDKIMDVPIVYKAFQNSVSSSKSRDHIQRVIQGEKKIENILDFGCGNGNYSQLFQDSNYLGIEPLSACVQMADARFSNAKTRFVVGDENSLSDIGTGTLDLVIAIGVLHHMEDSKAEFMSTQILRILKDGGRFYTIDPVYFSGQKFLAKFVISLDRGKNVRKMEDYLNLMKSYSYKTVNTKIYTDLIRIPYNHISIELIK